MKLKSTLLPIAVIACLIIYALFAIQTQTQQTFAINIDTAGAIAIQWPCEIAVIGDNGEKGLRIAPNIGRGWRGEAGGEAEYKFLVPADGKYHIWAYSLWFDECANAVFASIDGSEKTIIGNDPIYNKWHWVRGFDIDLKKGTHSLILSNHSDHIAIQKIVFLNNDYQTPQETGLVFSDIFYDGFDGCDQGNFSDWTILSGEWKVLPRPEMENRLDNTLVGTAQKNAFLIYQKDTWQSYSLNLSKTPCPQCR
ncbi:MAG: hypothetical protein H8D47_05435 [Planctomycetes bacterium]|nr:hypothetical protein [Planctomycetota bacterium]